MLWIRKIRDQVVLAQFALLAGGGLSFFLFARVLFDRLPAISANARYDAGAIVGPIIQIGNMIQNISGLTILMAALARNLEPGTPRRINRFVVIAGFLILLISTLERIFLIPRIQELRTLLGPGGFADGATSPERKEFGMLHGFENLAQIAVVGLAAAGVFLERAIARRTPA